VSLTDELLGAFESQIDVLALIPSSGGRFEVEVNGELLYSKLATGRHAEPGEINGLLQARLAT
jgi:selenoprotein W-related protein